MYVSLGEVLFIVDWLLHPVSPIDARSDGCGDEPLSPTRGVGGRCPAAVGPLRGSSVRAGRVMIGKWDDGGRAQVDRGDARRPAVMARRRTRRLRTVPRGRTQPFRGHR